MLQHLQPGLSCWQEVHGEGEQRFSMRSSGTADALCCTLMHVPDLTASGISLPACMVCVQLVFSVTGEGRV